MKRFAIQCLIALLVQIACWSGLAHAARAIDVAAGNAHSLQLRDDGTVWAWGMNQNGELGDGTKVDRSSPVVAQNLSGIVMISAYTQSYALDSNGRVWEWGPKTRGAEGRPARVTGLGGITQIAAGAGFILALRSDGTVWSWGNNNGSGQLGDGTTQARTTPAQIPGLTGIVAVAAGLNHSLAVVSDGRVFAWGGNAQGQLGLGTFGADQLSPVVIQGLTGVRSVAGGNEYSLAVKQDGTVAAWGLGGQLGDGSTARRAVAGPVPGLSGILGVSARTHSFAWNKAGKVWGWGNNSYGQLGDGTSTSRLAAVQLSLSPSGKVSAGYFHSIALKLSGAVAATGSNVNGELGIADVLELGSPAPVSGISSVIEAAAGGTASIALRANGAVWSWADFTSNEYAEGIFNQSFATPSPVAGLSGVFVSIRTNPVGDWNLALKEDGTVWAWGETVPGSEGFYYNVKPAIQIPGLAGIKAVSAGTTHFLALTTDRRARKIGCFSNDETCLPDFGFSDVIAIASGVDHALVLRADGSVWGLGGNAFGQVGNGTTTPVLNAPARVSVSNVVAIAAGGTFSAAIRANGTVVVWGLPPGADRETGQPWLQPAVVVELAGSKKLIAGYESLIAVDAFDKAKAWGFGPKLGPRDRLIPGRAPWADNVASIALGYSHSLTVSSEGRVLALGRNRDEQLGIERTRYALQWLEVQDPLNQAYTQNAVPVVEFRNDTIGTGHYFITAYPDEVLALDAGTFVKGWQRTGRAWRAWLDQAEAPANAKPVFRFFSSRWNSHFYTGEDAERQKLQNNNPTNDPAIDWALESTAFYALPATSNCPSVSVLPRSTYLCAVAATPAVVDCPVGYYPVYRAFDVGPTSPRTDPNHRFTSNWIDTYRDVRFFGFVYEGIGFCAPASSQSGGDLHAYHDYPGDAVDTGAPLQSQFWFNNAGPGDASGATIVAALPSGGAWSVECIAYQRAQCPGDLRPSVLRNGVVVPALPAGGLLQLIARGTAPATPQTLDFASAIGAPSGAPDPYALNNAAALSKTIVRTPVQCTVVLSPGALSVGAEGVSTDVAVEVPETCAWTVRSDQPWVMAAPAAGTGRGIFKLTAAANAATSERQAILSAQLPNGANVEVPVRQVRAPPPAPVVCPTVRLSREGEQVGANRVTNFVEVQAPEAECTWDVASEDSWIAVMAATRKGNGQVDYEVQPHQGTISRRGTIKIGNKVLDVIQAQVGSAQPSDSGGGGDSGGDGSGSGSGSGGDAGG